MRTEIIEVEPSPASGIYEIAAEVGEPFIEEIASFLWTSTREATSRAADDDADPWTHACCCCNDDDADGAAEFRGELDRESRRSAPLIIVVSPLMTDDWTDPLSVDEVVFGVRAKRRRRGSRSLEPVWIC